MKKRHLSTLIIAGCIPALSSAQALYNSGATINISSGTTVYVQGDLNNNTASSTISNNGTLRITGNTINNGTVSSPSGTNISLVGSTLQTLSGSATIAAGDVVVNNPAGITLSAPLQVSGAMTFTSGIISATSQTAPVVFTGTASLAVTPTDASHINGYAQKQGTGAFTFPIGDATKYQPVGINLTTNTSGMTARYYAADPGAGTYGTGGTSSTPLIAANRQEYWDLTPVAGAAGSVTIYFDGYKNTGIGNLADLRVAHKVGTQWLDEGATATSGTVASGSVTSNSVSSWSPFSLGSISLRSPLPVKLTGFTAVAEGKANRVSWNSAVEEAGTWYGIERSANGKDFTGIAQVDGTGKGSYEYYDEQPLPATTYYRLYLRDGSGEESYSQVVSVTRIGGGLDNKLIVSPVPADDQLNISCTIPGLEGTEAAIVNMAGQVMRTFAMNSSITIDLHLLKAGQYILRLADGTQTRFVKQ